MCDRGTWHWGILSGQSRGGLLRSERRRMPMVLTGWSTSAPSQLLNDLVWYLTLWEWPEVTVAIPDISVKSSCRSFLLLYCTIHREWENHRNARVKRAGGPAARTSGKPLAPWNISFLLGKKKKNLLLFVYNCIVSSCNSSQLSHGRSVLLVLYLDLSVPREPTPPSLTYSSVFYI